MMQVIPLVLVFGVFYLLVLRPDLQRQQDHASMLKSLAKDDGVVTTGGVHGVVASVAEATVEVEVARGVRVVFDKAAISRKKDPKRAA